MEVESGGKVTAIEGNDEVVDVEGDVLVCIRERSCTRARRKKLVRERLGIGPVVCASNELECARLDFLVVAARSDDGGLKSVLLLQRAVDVVGFILLVVMSIVFQCDNSSVGGQCALALAGHGMEPVILGPRLRNLVTKFRHGAHQSLGMNGAR